MPEIRREVESVSEIVRRMRSVTHHFVISSATMMSSFRMSAVNEMATMLRNSVSNRSNERIMIAPPAREKKDSARARSEER